jgi:hypothetical protein
MGKSIFFFKQCQQKVINEKLTNILVKLLKTDIGNIKT